VAVCSFLLVQIGCAQYQGQNGALLIAPIGDPPADTLIWSPVDSDSILITAADVGFDDAKVFILDMETGEKRIIAETRRGVVMGDAWSPDGARVLLRAFPETLGFEQGGLWIFTIDGNHLEFLAEGASRSAWSADGKAIATFIEVPNTSTDEIQIELHLMDFGLESDRIIALPSELSYPSGFSWSPDSHYLVFSSRESGGEENLFSLELETSNILKLTGNGENSQPSWSPDGEWIVYRKEVQDESGTVFDISLMKPDGSCNSKILELEYVLSPSWSPDSKQLAYIGPDGIYKLNIDKHIKSISCP
jgi:Tol biopolymer transport system component